MSVRLWLEYIFSKSGSEGRQDAAQAFKLRTVRLFALDFALGLALAVLGLCM